jgi:hypothetical protein
MSTPRGADVLDESAQAEPHYALSGDRRRAGAGQASGS